MARKIKGFCFFRIYTYQSQSIIKAGRGIILKSFPLKFPSGTVTKFSVLNLQFPICNFQFPISRCSPKLSREKFTLPESLKGKVFRATKFFAQKARASGATFLLQHLSHARHIKTPAGAFLHRRVTIPLDKSQSAEGYCFPGDVGSGTFATKSLATLAGEPQWQPSEHPRLIFLDLETTGLAGGTGTYPFLCGIGYFKPDSFIVEQFFMEDYPQESAMLIHLAGILETTECFVTFNGKSFDLPLLATRFIYNRIRIDLGRPHIDLLHPARRLWRGTLPDCRLETIEQVRFGLHRHRDIDSHLIPRIYFNFVRGRHIEWMLPVFDHNVQDVVSLGALLFFFCQLLSEPLPEDINHPLELWGLGRLFLKLGRIENALETFERALFHAHEPDLIEILLVHIGRLYKKLARWEDATQTWERLLNASRNHRIAAAIELAKYYEHRIKDPARAREVILRAIKGVEISSEIESYLSGMHKDLFSQVPPDIEHRLRRLERKIHRYNQPD